MRPLHNALTSLVPTGGCLAARLANLSVSAVLLMALLSPIGCTDQDIASGDSRNDVLPTGETASAKSETGALAVEQRQRVWDIEHLAFLMEAEVFPGLKSAIAAGDLSTVEFVFTDACAVRLPDPDMMQRRSLGVVGVTSAKRFRDATMMDLRLWVSDLRKRFDKGAAPRVSLGLVRLGPEELGGALEGAWRSEWKMQVSGMQDETPVDVFARIQLHLTHITESIASQRQWIDQFQMYELTVTESPNVLMSETSDAAGFPIGGMRDNWRPEYRDDFQTRTGGVYASDYDRNGVIDVLVDDLQLGRRLFRGRGDGTFEDVTEAAGLPTAEADDQLLWTGAVWADLDGDGFEDLISESRLFRNRRDGTFQDVTSETNLRLTPTAGYAVADYDLDGRVDLYVCHTGPYLPGQTSRDDVPWIDGALGVDNVLWRNLGDWKFQDVTSQTNAGAEGVTSFAAVWTDTNSDGRPDLLAINEFGKNCLLLNGREGFTSQPVFGEVFGGFSMGVTAGDVDNDGDLDVYVANMYSKAGNRITSNIDPDSYAGNLYEKLVDATLGSKLYLNDGQGKLVAQPGQAGLSHVGWAYGPAMGDFDGDGLLDIYATAGFRSVERGKPDG